MHSDTMSLGVGNQAKKCRQNVVKTVHFYAFICISQKRKTPENQHNSLIFKRLSGVGRDRTGDTRIFSPLLYRLSYRTIPLLTKGVANLRDFMNKITFGVLV